MTWEPSDNYSYLPQPSSIPVANLPEPQDRKAFSRLRLNTKRKFCEDKVAPYTAEMIGGGFPPQVIFSYQLQNDNEYPGYMADAAGEPRFISVRENKSESYVQYRIGGERPMRVVILKRGRKVYENLEKTGRSCMKIIYDRSKLPCKFIVRLKNGYVHDYVQDVFNIIN